MADQFRTVIGTVQFPPREGEAGGKPVRNITVRQAGFGPTAVNVSATLWPNFADIAVDEGDVVVLDGKYTSKDGTKQDGTKITYHNLSVTKIAVIGKVSDGVRIEVENAVDESDAADDDDIPF